jgi:hypothetical protein
MFVYVTFNFSKRHKNVRFLNLKNPAIFKAFIIKKESLKGIVSRDWAGLHWIHWIDLNFV